MILTQVRSPQQQSPLFYWAALAMLVGIPNFVHFDSSGRTANTFNATSLSYIFQAAATGYLFVLVILLERQPILRRKVSVSVGLWVALFLQFAFASMMRPESRLTPPSAKDILMPIFLLSQWAVAFMLFLALYARTPRERATQLVVDLIGRASWVWIIMVWILLPIMPGQAYGASEDSSASAHRLGGQLTHPGKLAVLACIAFFYALLFFPKGLRKWISCAVAIITLVLTGARTGELGFIVSLLLFGLIFAKSPVLRWGTLSVVALGGIVAFVFQNLLLTIFARGQSLQTLATLDDRTRIWSASWEAIKLRPIIGYGYASGARNALKDHWKYVHWVPPHAHNEFIQALLDGGLIALFLILCIYSRVLWFSIRDSKRGPQQLFLMLVLSQILVTTVSGPILTYGYEILSGIFVLCFFGVVDGAQGGTRPRLGLRKADRQSIRGSARVAA